MEWNDIIVVTNMINEIVIVTKARDAHVTRNFRRREFLQKKVFFFSFLSISLSLSLLYLRT